MKTISTLGAALILSFGGIAAAQQTATPEDEAKRSGIPATEHQEQATREVQEDTQDKATAGTRGQTEEGMPATPHQEKAVEEDLLAELDQDGDGQISQQEAQVETQLTDNWDELDENQDGMLDSGELSQLEERLSDIEEAE
jgi:hypothetical protein